MSELPRWRWCTKHECLYEICPWCRAEKAEQRIGELEGSLALIALGVASGAAAFAASKLGDRPTHELWQLVRDSRPFAVEGRRG
jgi:hypothetical protein